MLTQWGSLGTFPVNTGQLLGRTMEERGQRAYEIFMKFVSKISARSSDCSDPKIPVTIKSTVAQTMVSAYEGATGERTVGKESRLRGVFGIGHLPGGRYREGEGSERSRKRGMTSFETRNSRQKLDIAALTEVFSRTGAKKGDGSESEDEESNETNDPARAVVGRLCHSIRFDTREEASHTLHTHKHNTVGKVCTEVTSDNGANPEAMEEREWCGAQLHERIPAATTYHSCQEGD